MDSDVLFVIMDANKGNPADTLLNQLSRLSQKSPNESRQPIFLLLNKAENLPPSQRREVKRFCKENHGDRFRDVVLVSALQLNEAKDEEPLDALDSAMQRMRSAYKARDSFQESISAKLTAQSYRLDISGNVYDVAASSDFELASREQLAEMVKNVAAERHVLLEQQFQRQTLQLRENWQTTLSELDLALKRATDKAFIGGRDEAKRKETVLKAIEKANSDTFTLVTEVFREIPYEIVTKNQRAEKGILLDTVYYQVFVAPDKASDIMDVHGNWRRIFDIYQRLLSYIERSLDINFDFTPQQVVEHLKEIFLDRIRNVVQEIVQELQNGGWKSIGRGKFWKYEYKDSEHRDGYFNHIIQLFASRLEDSINGLVIQKVQKEVIDRLTKAVISTTERNQSQATRKAEELRKLRERISEMKEHTL